MCSSTPIVFTPAARSPILSSFSARDLTADQQVSQATPRCRATADTVVSSCLSASTAQSTAQSIAQSMAQSMARVVSFARGSAQSWSSVQVGRAHAGSGQRQIRLDHCTRTGRPKHGASWQELDPATLPDRAHPAVQAAGQPLVRLDIHDHHVVGPLPDWRLQAMMTEPRVRGHCD